MIRTLLFLTSALAMSAAALADVVNLQCSGFPRNPWAMLGNTIAVDASRQMIKSLDSHNQWISAQFSEGTIQWVSHGATGDGTRIDYVFGLDRAGLRLNQGVSAGGRAVYTGWGQCQIVQLPRNQL